MKQTTIKQGINIHGVGLHSGCRSELLLKPAAPDSGVVFCRSDIKDSSFIPALYKNVSDTRNCTCLQHQGTTVSTVEHLMAALYAAGIDNVTVECSNQELPIMDGSAAVFYDILQQAEKVEQSAPRKYLKVLRNVCFEDGKGGRVELMPTEDKNLSIEFEIEFPSKVVGRQIFKDKITPEVFARSIAPCRTFCEKYQIDYLKSLGLIKGGSLDNAVVLDGEKILNPGGFRLENECVNHKVLDLIGDLFTSGHRLLASVKASRSGHFHNNEVLKKLFADPQNYELTEE